MAIIARWRVGANKKPAFTVIWSAAFVVDLWYAELHAPKRSAAADYGTDIYGPRKEMWW
jgi:hypothetical protein